MYPERHSSTHTQYRYRMLTFGYLDSVRARMGMENVTTLP